MSEGGLVMSYSCAAAAAANNNNNNNNSNNNNAGRTSTCVPRRKFSFPAILHSSSANHHGAQPEPGFGVVGHSSSLAVATARRRFSNVSDVVSRKLSHTIGWRTAVPTEQIARQGMTLCSRYIRWKLKRVGAYTKRCAGALRNARPTTTSSGVDDAGGRTFMDAVAADDVDADVTREVFAAVLRVGQQLERLDPKLYAGKAAATRLQQHQHRGHHHGHHRSAGRVGSGRRNNEAAAATAAVVLVSVSRELFRAGVQVTWAKVVSLMCVAAGLAVDCARRGRAEQLPDLIEAVGEVIEDDLAAWIHYNGGWMGLQSYCKPVVINVENTVSTQILYLVSLLIIVILFLLLLRWFNFISVFR